MSNGAGRNRFQHMVILCAVMVASLIVLGGAPLAATEFPTKPINIIVNYGPGGGTDLPARALSSVIHKYLGQPFIVTNKPGGGAQIGSSFVAKAKPDGYTLLLTYGGLEQTFAPHLRKLPYDPLNDFIPITTISIYDCVLDVRADAPWKNLKELIEDAKKKPGKIRFGRSGTFGTNHLQSLLFKRETGIPMKINLPFEGGTKTITGLLGGHIDVAFLGQPFSMQHYLAGKIRMLGLSAEKRNKFLPDVPTYREAGYDIVLGNVKGIAAPKGTPMEIVNKLHDAIIKATKDKAFKKMMNNFYQPVVTMERKEFAAFVRKQYDRWGRFVKEMGLKVKK
ncbi:MAG: tripartite tricarboxylate transporter substrate binding protein [Deltaproteobacteria bacterium]|nr:tripartite tricarboxylate transporter substrate binding protein [Deltaproteobacteria bacterium]MBW2309283.1 tripartite tricarboxylate transporter substrate binding protein [Deltaproteobacteria bacterium]